MAPPFGTAALPAIGMLSLELSNQAARDRTLASLSTDSVRTTRKASTRRFTTSRTLVSCRQATSRSCKAENRKGTGAYKAPMQLLEPA